MRFFNSKLEDEEYLQLLKKGYLKIKFKLPISELKEFDLMYRVSESFSFKTSSGAPVSTVITSIEVGEDDKSFCRIFIGFALK
jgi:hypothetical protein